MRTDIPSALQTHLNSRETTLCWCWKITRRDGTVMGFTNHDRDLTFGSVTYEASTGFLGTEVESKLGMSVDNMDVFGAVDSTNITEADIESGEYDNADIELYIVNWSDVSQRVIMKKGNIGEVSRGQTMFKAEVRGISHEMQEVRGRLFSYTCDAKLGDTRCGKDVSGSTYTGSGTVTSVDGRSSITASGLSAYTSGWFTRGKITFTSGNNNGVTKEIRFHTNTSGVVTVSFWEPMPFDIAVSDTFDIVAGCNKFFRTCKAKFDNADNFRGFPHVPGNSTLKYYATVGDPNLDGGGNFNGKD